MNVKYTSIEKSAEILPCKTSLEGKTKDEQLNCLECTSVDGHKLPVRTAFTEIVTELEMITIIAVAKPGGASNLSARNLPCNFLLGVPPICDTFCQNR